MPPPPGPAAPDDLDALVADFERFSAGLVRLARPSLDDVRRTIARFAGALDAHLAAPPVCDAAHRARLDAEHVRFRTSIEQLWWFFRIVEADDHGGHRQALGQYGRLLAEALERHRAEERSAATPPATNAK